MAQPYNETYSTGEDMPPEALQQGSMNQHPNFEPNKGDEPEAKKVKFGTVKGGRQKFVEPGRYPLNEKRVKDLDGKLLVVKGLTRVDH